jgi:hypothetical protein
MSVPGQPEPAEDQARVETRVKHFRIEKRDAATGELFEVVEGGDDEPTTVTYRRLGQPTESYADVGED